MVKGFRSPRQIQLDLMRTYNASRFAVFTAPLAGRPALPVHLDEGGRRGEPRRRDCRRAAGEGTSNGIGARLLAGSYYGQTIQIWSALLTAALLAGALIALVGLAERLTNQSLGARA